MLKQLKHMETFLELLKYTVPSLIVGIVAYLVMQKFLDNEHRKQLLELRRANQKATTPLRLQAAERLVLFLERISLNNLVLRLHKEGMSAVLLKAELRNAVKDEFEHNLTQQIYISATSWETTRKAKDEILNVINLASTQVTADAPAADLGQRIFEIMVKLEKSPSQIAINVIKQEIRQLF